MIRTAAPGIRSTSCSTGFPIHNVCHQSFNLDLLNRFNGPDWTWFINSQQLNEWRFQSDIRRHPQWDGNEHRVQLRGRNQIWIERNCIYIGMVAEIGWSDAASCDMITWIIISGWMQITIGRTRRTCCTPCSTWRRSRSLGSPSSPSIASQRRTPTL